MGVWCGEFNRSKDNDHFERVGDLLRSGKSASFPHATLAMRPSNERGEGTKSKLHPPGTLPVTNYIQKKAGFLRVEHHTTFTVPVVGIVTKANGGCGNWSPARLTARSASRI